MLIFSGDLIVLLVMLACPLKNMKNSSNNVQLISGQFIIEGAKGLAIKLVNRRN